MFALNIAEDGRILSATYRKYAVDGMPIVEELPEGDISDYLYLNERFVFDPMPEPEGMENKPISAEIEELITSVKNTNTAIERTNENLAGVVLEINVEKKKLEALQNELDAEKQKNAAMAEELAAAKILLGVE